jgi:hypothetical protein
VGGADDETVEVAARPVGVGGAARVGGGALVEVGPGFATPGSRGTGVAVGGARAMARAVAAVRATNGSEGVGSAEPEHAVNERSPTAYLSSARRVVGVGTR